jgi:hypothetical protein
VRTGQPDTVPKAHAVSSCCRGGSPTERHDAVGATVVVPSFGAAAKSTPTRVETPFLDAGLLIGSSNSDRQSTGVPSTAMDHGIVPFHTCRHCIANLVWLCSSKPQPDPEPGNPQSSDDCRYALSHLSIFNSDPAKPSSRRVALVVGSTVRVRSIVSCIGRCEYCQSPEKSPEKSRRCGSNGPIIASRLTQGLRGTNRRRNIVDYRYILYPTSASLLIDTGH